MRWKSLLTYSMASMCSTTQSPRAAKAFSRACAARTWPAPDAADSNKTRGFAFMRRPARRRSASSGSLGLASRQLLENSTRGALQFAEARQVFLKIVIQRLRFLRAELDAQNHVAQFDGMRQGGFFLQFFECRLWIVVIHGFPRVEAERKSIVLG